MNPYTPTSIPWPRSLVQAIRCPRPSDGSSRRLRHYPGGFEHARRIHTDDVDLSICRFPATDGNWRGRNDVVAAARNSEHYEICRRRCGWWRVAAIDLLEISTQV